MSSDSHRVAPYLPLDNRELLAPPLTRPASFHPVAATNIIAEAILGNESTLHESGTILSVGSQSQARSSETEVGGGVTPSKHNELKMKCISTLLYTI